MCFTDNERGYIMSKTDNILRYLSWWAIVASVGSLVMLSFVSTTFFIPGANFVATMFLLLGMTGSFPLLLASAVLLLLYFFGAKLRVAACRYRRARACGLCYVLLLPVSGYPFRR